MPKFYFTYSDDPAHPFYGGWTVIEAPRLKDAVEIFNMLHPSKEKNRDGSPILNCADYYTEERFLRTNMIKKGKLGAYCHEEYSLSGGKKNVC